MTTTNNDPTTQEWQAAMMRSAGPPTDPGKMSFFDIAAMEWTGVVTGREGPEDVGNPMTSLKALVNPGGDEGCSLQAVKYRPAPSCPDTDTTCHRSCRFSSGRRAWEAGC
jgi:hypothetical protein